MIWFWKYFSCRTVVAKGGDRRVDVGHRENVAADRGLHTRNDTATRCFCDFLQRRRQFGAGTHWWSFLVSKTMNAATQLDGATDFFFLKSLFSICFFFSLDTYLFEHGLRQSCLDSEETKKRYIGESKKKNNHHTLKFIINSQCFSCLSIENRILFAFVVCWRGCVDFRLVGCRLDACEWLAFRDYLDDWLWVFFQLMLLRSLSGACFVLCLLVLCR